MLRLLQSRESGRINIIYLKQFIKNSGGLDLNVNDGVFEGEILVSCKEGYCGDVIKDMANINENEKINLTIRAAREGETADLFIKGSARAAGKGNAGVFQKTNWVERTFLRLRSVIAVNPAAARKYTAAHELGHALGLNHAPNSSGTLMSYAENRSAQLTEGQMTNLLDAYR